MENRGILHPSVNYIGVRGDGEVASDFPLIYYTIGKIWKSFGQNEWIYRFLVFSLFIFGISFFFSVSRIFLKDNVWAGFISLLLFTSPVIAYYSCNFLMNLPAFSFALIGLSAFFHFYRTGKNYYLWFSCLAYVIGGLIKVPALLSFVIICFIYVTESTGIIRYEKERKIFASRLSQMIPLLLVILVELSWIIYFNKYNKGNGGLFLVGIYPIWDLTRPEIKNIVDIFFDYWFTQHFSLAVHLVSLGMLFWTIYNLKRFIPVLKVFIILGFIGVLLYIILWFQALLYHDYYVTNTYIYFLITWACAIKILIDRFPKIAKSSWVKSVFILFILYNVWYCGKEIDLRYNGPRNDFYRNKYQGLSDLKPALRELGITRMDTFIVLGDETINGSLYLLDQKGWTNCGGFMNNMDSIKIKKAIHSGAKYMITLDSTWEQKDFVKPFTQHQIFTQDNYKVFQVK
jgi:hypothetical protein